VASYLQVYEINVFTIISIMRATCPAHLTRFDYITLIMFREEYKLRYLIFLPVSPCSFDLLPVTSTYSTQNFVPVEPQL